MGVFEQFYKRVGHRMLVELHDIGSSLPRTVIDKRLSGYISIIRNYKTVDTRQLQLQTITANKMWRNESSYADRGMNHTLLQRWTRLLGPPNLDKHNDMVSG
jgi:hypothetical protein